VSVADGRDFEQHLAALAAALETGLDLPAVLATACAAAAAAAGAAAARAYTVAEDGAAMLLVCGDGSERIAPVTDIEPSVAAGRTMLPLVSGRRVVGCIVADAEADPAGLSRARIVAAIAAQAAEASRLWESAGGGAGTLDLLTGLPNHRGFQSVLARELARAKRTGQSLAVSLLDIDGLAAYNDRKGRAEGDRMLRLAAECFARGVRSYDCVCRLGEDEYALVLPGMNAESAATLVSRLSATFASWAPSEHALTVSGGVASFPQHAGTQAELVGLAGTALAAAQGAGGGRISAYDPRKAADDDASRERDHQRTLRTLEASRGASSRSGAASEYAAHLAGELGLDADRADRLRIAAFVYDSTAPAGDERERGRLTARVAANALDADAAEWILARGRPAAERPLESRILAVADAFVRADGHTSSSGAGRALAELWSRGDSEFDPQCIRALERLLAAGGHTSAARAGSDR
jgi:diguanylate cyclase (GGDEF)-like protein